MVRQEGNEQRGVRGTENWLMLPWHFWGCFTLPQTILWLKSEVLSEA